jgi:microcystin-dependent protein
MRVCSRVEGRTSGRGRWSVSWVGGRRPSGLSGMVGWLVRHSPALLYCTVLYCGALCAPDSAACCVVVGGVESGGLFLVGGGFGVAGTRKYAYSASMPVASEISRIQYTGNGSSVTPYSVPFYFLSEADIKVVLTDGSGVESSLTETTHYVLSGAGEAGGGSLTTVAAYDGTHTLTIYREPEQTQSAEFQSTGALPADTLTRGLDKLTMLVQSLSRKVTRCFRLNDKAGDVVALSEATRANTVFGFGAGGDPMLRDRVALLSLLSLSSSLQGAPTAFWSDDGERALKVPDFVGQLGLQLNTSALYRSIGASAGSWSLLIRDEDDMTGNDALRAPSQQSVKAYVDARDVVSVATAQAAASAADAAYLPAGAVIPFAGTVSPSGWLLCYGQAVSRVTYGTLFAAVGTTYGTGDGSTTFNVPDLRGRAVAGKDDMGGSAASRLTNSGTGNPGVNGSALGAAGGADRHQLTIGQMPAHTHSIVYNNSIGAAASGVILGSNSGSSTGSTGGDQAHPNLQPTLVLNYIIRA